MRLVPAILLLVVATVVPAADEPTAPEPLETELNRIKNAMINASGKLKNGIVGLDPGGKPVPPTPAWSCCAANLRRIEKSVLSTQRILLAFEDCFEMENDQGMLLSTRVARSDLDKFVHAVGAFAEAKSSGHAQAGLDSMTRTYLLLRETSVKLRTCSTVPAESPVSEDEPGASSAGD